MDKLLVTFENGIKRITFNAPDRRNAVDQEMVEYLHHLVLETARDATRVLVLAGAGDAFCSGADVKGMLSRGRSFDVTEHPAARHQPDHCVPARDGQTGHRRRPRPRRWYRL